jgi:hypothetical protein
MNKFNEKQEDLYSRIYNKSKLKQEVYKNTLETFKTLKIILKQIETNFNNFIKTNDNKLTFEVKQKGEFEIEVKFGGDILLFMMHTNIFEFPRNHAVLQTPYVKENKERSYCGTINIYNFLADSFKYNRVNDVGYLIGRLFINNEKHYFIEGKKELGFIFNNFGKNAIDETSIMKIAEAAIDYTINFDLLTPPYENVKYVSVQAIKNTIDTISLKTGKRLGFKFQADNE